MTERQKEFYSQVRQGSENKLNELAESGASDGAMRMQTLTQLLDYARLVVIRV